MELRFPYLGGECPTKILTFFSDFSKFLKNVHQAYSLNPNP